jgi:uncharacterized membrane protein YhaH (DUF805 family)
MNARLKSLFSFSGRSSRLGYWRGQLLLALLLAGVWVATLFAVMATPFGAVLGLLGLPLIVLAAAIATRRLHDRNKGMAWLAVFWLAPFLCYMLAEVLSEHEGAAILATAPLSLAGFGLSVWGLIEIGFLRGSVAANRFGEPPPVRRI